MKNLQVDLSTLIVILFLIMPFFSCNNEEIFVEKVIIVKDNTEETEEEENTEDTIVPVDVVDDEVNTIENIPVEIFVFTNDTTLPDAGSVSNTDPANGTLSIDDNGTSDNDSDDIITYTPQDGFFGIDSFEYTVCDILDPDNCDTALVVINIEENEFSTELKAFPSAYGGGAYATGGRGGNVYHVTNLNGDYSTGSLLWAVTQPRPANIVFDVSGTIDMGSNFFVIAGSDLTISGQTAPLGGITITSSDPNWKTRFWECENLIIRYIRVRYQAGNGSTGIDMYGGGTAFRNTILDHVSISGAGWAGIALRGVKSTNVTFQNGLIAECKTGAIWGDGDPNFRDESYDNSFNGNFFYNVPHRFPNAASTGRVDAINNVVQNNVFRLTSAGHYVELNHINNYIIPGAKTAISFSGMNRAFSDHPTYNADENNVLHVNKIYSSGNIITNGIFENPNADNKLIWSKWEGGYEVEYLPSKEFVDTMHPLLGAPHPIISANQAYQNVINNQDKGASKMLNADGSVSDNRDANDLSYFSITATGEYEPYTSSNNWVTSNASFFNEQRYFNFLASISSTPINTRPAGYDTDDDGMPDIWEKLNGYNFEINDSSGDRDGDGYTNLEEFLNSVDK